MRGILLTSILLSIFTLTFPTVSPYAVYDVSISFSSTSAPPGGTSTATVSVTNTGNVTIYNVDVRVTLTSNYSTESDWGKVREYIQEIDSLSPGETRTVQRTIDIKSSAIPKDYPIWVDVVANRDDGGVYAKGLQFYDGVTVTAPTPTYDVSISFSSTSAPPGGTSTVTVSVTNTGTKTLECPDVALYFQVGGKSETYSSWGDYSDTNIRYLNLLSPGEPGTAEFTFDIKDSANPGNYEIKIIVEQRERCEVASWGAGTWSKSFYDTITVTAPQKGSISVSSSPSGANVYLDGSYKGTTPMTITNVSEGSYTLKLTNSGYGDYSQTVSVSAGDTATVSATLTPETPKKSSIYVSSTPSGSNVYFDNLYKGITPLTIPDVSVGSHTIKLTRENYEDYTTTLYIEAGQRRDIAAQLTIKDSDRDGITDDIDQCPYQPETFNNYLDTDGCPDEAPQKSEKEEPKCFIDLSTSPSADVLIDRKFIGKTPLIEELLCGKYFLKVEKEGYESWEKVVELSKDSPEYEATITLSPSKKLEISNYEIDEKHLALIPIILGALGFLIKVFKG